MSPKPGKFKDIAYYDYLLSQEKTKVRFLLFIFLAVTTVMGFYLHDLSSSLSRVCDLTGEHNILTLNNQRVPGETPDIEIDSICLHHDDAGDDSYVMKIQVR